MQILLLDDIMCALVCIILSFCLKYMHVCMFVRSIMHSWISHHVASCRDKRRKNLHKERSTVDEVVQAKVDTGLGDMEHKTEVLKAYRQAVSSRRVRSLVWFCTEKRARIRIHSLRTRHSLRIRMPFLRTRMSPWLIRKNFIHSSNGRILPRMLRQDRFRALI